VAENSQSDLSQTKLLESGKAARRLLDRLGQPRLSAREMADILTLIAKETSVLKTWTYTLSQITTFGATAFAKKWPSQATEVGLDDYGLAQVTNESDRDPWQIPRVRQRFTDEARIQFNLKMNSMDALSQLGSLAFDDPRDSEKWIAVNPEVWTSWAKRGSIATIRGGIKTGKTNLSLLLAEHFIKKGHVVVANIVVHDPPPAYVYCAKLSDMLVAVCEARLQNKEVCVILDEGGLFWAKIETVRPRNIDLSKLLLAYGKLHACLVFISHFEEQLPGIISRNSVCNFEKRGLREVFVEVNEGVRIRPRLLTSVPPTNLKYDPDQLQYYTLDMDVNQLFDFMSSLPQGANQWELVLDYVRKRKGETGEDALDPKQVALWLKQRGQSERKISELVQKSPSTVHGWVATKK